MLTAPTSKNQSIFFQQFSMQKTFKIKKQFKDNIGQIED